jgi:two-component system chemotaxis response regulator CheY
VGLAESLKGNGSMAHKILLVDDSKTVRQQVAVAMTQAGFVTVEAGDGQEALDQMAKNADVKMIVCDVNMPRMSGLEFLAAMKQAGKMGNPPVVMLTTEGKNDVIDKAKALGVRGWVVKPFKAEQLIAAAKKLTGM